MIDISYLDFYDGVAIISNDCFYSYKELNQKIKFYESILENYTKSRIAVIGDFNFETICLFIAFRNTNNIFIPIVFTTDQEVTSKTNEANANVIFRFNWQENNFKIEENNNFEINKNEDLSGLILFSSGTTGKPKMMFHQFDKLFSILQNRPRKRRSLKILLFLMFDHIGGINTLLNCLKDGSTIVIPNDRNPDSVCDIINKYKVNVLPTTPTFLNLLLMNSIKLEEKLNSLKLISYGTERMPESLLLKLKKGLPNVKLLQTFGTSETGILKTVSKSSDSLYFKIEDERYKYKIVNNVLFIKSNLSIEGYLNFDSDKFDIDGYYNTGDIVEIDDDGFLMIVGRTNEVINVGGLKVMPVEIEEVLLNHIGIKDCLIYGKSNSITGQNVCARITVNEYFANFTMEEVKTELKSYCRSRLDKYKIPSRIEIVNSLEFTSRFKKKISE